MDTTGSPLTPAGAVPGAGSHAAFVALGPQAPWPVREASGPLAAVLGPGDGEAGLALWLAPADRATLARALDAGCDHGDATVTTPPLTLASGAGQVALCLQTVTDGEGRVTGFLGQVTRLPETASPDSPADLASGVDALLAACPEAALCLDTQGRVRRLNPAAERLLGYAAAVCPIGLDSLVLSADRAIWRALRQETARGGTPPPRTLRFHTRTGAVVWGTVTARSLRLPPGDTPTLVLFIQDTTVRNTVALAFPDTERPEGRGPYRALIDASQEGFLMADSAGRLVEVNHALCMLTGREEADLLGRSALDLVTPEDRETLAGLFAVGEGTNHRQRSVVVRVPVPATPGETRSCRVNATLLTDEDDPAVVLGAFAFITDVTVQRQAHEAVRASEARYRTLVNSIQDGLVMIQEGRFTFANASVARMVGARPEDLIGRPLTDVLAPEDQEWVLARYRRRLAGDPEPTEYEVTLTPLDGSPPRRVNLHAAVLQGDDDDTPPGTIATVHDITLRREAENALRASETTRRAILNAIAHSILLLDKEGAVLLANERAESEWGVVPGDGPGPVTDLLPAPLAAQIKTTLAQAQQDCTPVSTELRLQERWMEITVHPVRETAQGRGPCARSVLVLRDITARKTAERALRDQLAFANTLLQTLSHPVYFTEESGRMMGVNRAMARFFGARRDQLVGRPFSELLPEGVQARSRQADSMLLTTGGMQVLDVTMPRAGGEPRQVLITKSAFRHDDGRIGGLIGVMVDITTHKQVETRLQSLVRELERSNAELEQFAYVASHDLQEPLRMVRSYVKLLRTRLGSRLDDEAREFMDFAVDGAERMQSMIQDLLDYSRVDRQGGALAPLPLGEVVAGALANLRVAVADAGATVTVADSFPTVHGDRSQLLRLFQNLIGNALKYRQPDRPPEIAVTFRREGPFWVISVGDNGRGIPARDLERVFLIFQRLQRRDQAPGNGIGLAIARKIVERHGGRIWAESEEGAGSHFRFTLPVKGGDQAPVSAETLQAELAAEAPGLEEREPPT